MTIDTLIDTLHADSEMISFEEMYEDCTDLESQFDLLMGFN
jgi:hypothetical protein